VRVQYQFEGRSAREIVASVEAAVGAGSLVAGQRMPPIRGLAEQLSVSPATVAAAYRMLSERGVVLTAGRAGTTVALRPPLPTGRSGLALPAGVRDLRMGFPDLRLLPELPLLEGFSRPSLPSRHESPNDPALLQLAASGFARDGVPAERLAVVAGAMDGIERTLQAHLTPGDRVAVEDPGYPPVADLLRSMGMTVVPVAVDDQGAHPSSLTAAIKRGACAVVLTSRAQNPLGAALSPARADELAEVLANGELLVIEDDHAAGIAGARYAPVAPRSSPRWVVVRSVSKSLGPDLRLAVVAGDHRSIDRIEGRQALGTGWVSTVLQRAVAALWSDAEVQTLLARAERSYAERRQALIDALAQRGLVAHGASGLNVWLEVSSESAAVEALLQAGWAVAPGERFRLRATPGVRITVSNLDLAECDEVAELFAQTLSARAGVYPAY
jgi:DNA-binding transcriptional MocR family regulator